MIISRDTPVPEKLTNNTRRQASGLDYCCIFAVQAILIILKFNYLQIIL